MSGGKRPGHVVTVVEVIEETDDSRSLVFRVPEGLEGEFSYRPGQFLTLNVPSKLEPTARCYSLSSSPYLNEPHKVTIKRTVGGYASNLLCGYPQVPFSIEVLKPSGHFVPESLDADFILFAGGSGVTPVMSIIKSVLNAGTGTCHLYYANRDAASTIFRDEFLALADEFPGRFAIEWWNEDERGGVPSEESVVAMLDGHPDCQVFTCGPPPFMRLVRAVLEKVGHPHDNYHFEEFVSLEGDPFAPIEDVVVEEGTELSVVDVELDGEEYSVEWPATRTLVDVLLSKDIDVPYSCRSGECGSCVCTLVEGTVDPGNNELLDEEDIADGVILGCQSKPTSPKLRIEF